MCGGVVIPNCGNEEALAAGRRRGQLPSAAGRARKKMRRGRLVDDGDDWEAAFREFSAGDGVVDVAMFPPGFERSCDSILARSGDG